MTFKYSKDVLPNRVRIVTESSRSADSVALGIWVGVGSSCEPAHLSGAAHFIEHLFFKGTKRRSSFELANALESVGGSLDGYAGKETTTYVCRCLNEHLRKGIDVLCDMYCHSLMREEAIEIEKKVISEEIRSYEDSPEDIAFDLLCRSVWKKNPLGNPILGTIETVNGMTRKSLRDFYRTFYVGSNTIIAAAGKIDRQRLVEYVNRILRIPYRREVNSFEVEGTPLARIHHERRKVTQCYVAIGTECPRYADKRKYAATLLAQILGGGMTSRLFQEVREKHGLVYSIHSGCELYRATGMIYIFFAVDPRKVKRAVSSVLKEIHKIRRDGIAKSELVSAKKQLRGNTILAMESPLARMGRIARMEFCVQDYLTVDDLLMEVSHVTREKVMFEAEKLLNPENLSMVVVGPPGVSLPDESDFD
ncbi:MAG: M16 family metallopeptidase [bacterium]